ncbi:hypothetical protein BF95_10185 [Sphingobium sp. Ant17]|nr:hypothetical protein BF95_10185 [Sphingobium sp. Ant17]
MKAAPEAVAVGHEQADDQYRDEQPPESRHQRRAIADPLTQDEGQHQRGRAAPDDGVPGAGQARMIKAAPSPLGEPDGSARRRHRAQRQAEQSIGDLDRQAAIITEVEIIGRCRRLLAQCAVGQARLAMITAPRIEHIIFAEDEPLGMEADDLHMLTGG